MSLTALFDASFTGRADREGLEYTDAGGASQTLTFGDVDARANRMAHELAARGIARGERLCVHVANRVEFIDLFLACTRLGVVFVPINVLYRERELAHIIADSDPKAVVVDDIPDARYPAGVPRWPVADLAAAARQQPATRPAAGVDDKTPAVIIYTSGTTGTAKGAVLTHGSVAANARTLASAWRITDADRYLAVLPLFHVHGLANGVCSWLLSGCRMRLVERFDHKTIAAEFRDFRPTLFFGVPTIYARLLDTSVVSGADARAIAQQMRLFVSGSAPLSALTFNDFRTRFGHAILERYGMSEALMITSNPHDGERRPGSVGPPLPGVQVRLEGEDSAPHALGHIGEVQVRSPALFAGYWRNETATKAAFTADGWFHTGDLGTRHDDGCLELVGRNHDLIISGGFNIYPREIEDVLLQHRGVREAVVVGARDVLKGEVPIAYVVADASFDAASASAMLRASLASFKIPRAFIRMDALPRNALGKIQKHLLPPWQP